MNKIVIELHEDDRARIDLLTESIQRLANLMAPPPLPTLNVGDDKYSILPNQDEPEQVEAPEADKNPAEEPKEEPGSKEAKSEVTMEDLQNKTVELVNAGKRAETLALVNKYADRVCNIPEDKWGEVFNQMNALG